VEGREPGHVRRSPVGCRVPLGRAGHAPPPARARRAPASSVMAPA
jgi:hypothetical protein